MNEFTPPENDADAEDAPIQGLGAIEDDIVRVDLDGKEIVLLGTAHISQESVDAVERVIEHEAPDVVCVELDEERYKALRQDQKFEDLDLIEVIKQGKLTFLLARLALTAFQKRMGEGTGVTPGAEMAAAADAAEAMGVPVELSDRNVRITLLRAWRRTPWWRRAEVAAMLFLSLFQSGDIDEEELADLRKGDMISEVLEELGDVFPEVKEVLVDERDVFMARSIQDVEADKIVVIIGAAHRAGIARWLRHSIPDSRIDEVTTIPQKSSISKVLPWLIPALVVGLFAYGFFAGGGEGASRAAWAWVLYNGVLSSVGAAAALGHPLTIAAAFLAAPLTSLNPMIGAGMVTALVQARFAAPKVKDFHSIGDDLTEWKGWWSNKLGRVLLVFIFSSLGSVLGTALASGHLITWIAGLL